MINHQHLLDVTTAVLPNGCNDLGLPGDPTGSTRSALLIAFDDALPSSRPGT